MSERRVSGRFTLLEKPNAYPFADLVNNTPEGPVFDLGIDLEMRDGVVYIKAEHVQEMAEQLGMLSEEEADALRNENASLKAIADTIPEKIERFKNGIDALVRSYHDDLLAGDGGTGIPDAKESTGQERGEPSGDNSGVVRDSDESKSESHKSDGQGFSVDFLKGTNGLSSNSSNDKSGTSNTGR